jgi:hypothetical protein
MSSPVLAKGNVSTIEEYPYFPSSYIKAKIKDFAQKANLFADQFFASNNSNEYSINHHHHYHSYSPFYSFYSPWWNPVIYVGDSRRARRDNDDESAKIFLSIIATIGTLVASYAIGIAWSRLNDANEELDQTKEFAKDLSYYQYDASLEDQILLAQAKEAVSLKDRICKRITNSATWDLAIRIAIAAGCALTAVSAVIAPPSLAIGVSLTIISLSTMLFKWGFDGSEKANIRDAQFLKASLENFNRL